MRPNVDLPAPCSPGIRRNQAEQYRDVIERGALRTSLLPESLDPKAREERRRAVNLRVSFAFQATLRKSGLTDNVVSRDFFAVEKLAAVTAPRSLREGPGSDLAVDVARFESAHGRLPDETWLSWKRFFVFLRDTGRVDDDEVLDALDAIKELDRRAPHRRYSRSVECTARRTGRWRFVQSGSGADGRVTETG